jgi:arginyl-tRNA synthetase
MYDYKEFWKRRVAAALNMLLKESGLEETVESSRVVAEIPPQDDMGDLGFPMFTFAKSLRKSPAQIAALVCERLETLTDRPPGEGAAAGPYVNVRFNRGPFAAALLTDMLRAAEPAVAEPAGPGPVLWKDRPAPLAGSRIMVEFSSPNTNKPLHLGHLRNDVLGESVSRILAACGAEIRKVCIINDRGVHICKSMLAYQEYGRGKTPQSEGIKSDHFVGDWYVKFHQIQGQDASAEERALDLLRKWEAGDRETVELWKLMNSWAVEGMKKTYLRTGVSFDQYYFESETYLLGREEVLKGLERGLFYRAEDGAVMVDLDAEKLDKKALLRRDGTSIYITQDIGTAIFRHRDWPFDRLIYVVGSEQQYHFQVLFAILKKLGFGWAQNLYHLSYGMVNLPEGKMKSREGTVVDADELLDSLRDMALREIRDKDREAAVGDSLGAAEKVALGALHYYLLSVSPGRDMLFNPRESLSFNGNTGPYLQYMGARIASMLRKARDEQPDLYSASLQASHAGLLTGDAEWSLIKVMAAYPDAVSEAAAGMDPSLLALYIYELSKAFSRFYHDCPILNAPDRDLAAARLALSRGALWVLRGALDLICIPFLETM